MTILLPEAGDYLKVRMPYLYAEGTCRQALEAMGEAWTVPRGIWAPMQDGATFWGDWADSPFNQGAFKLDTRLVVERNPEARALVLPYLPRLRPGVVVEDSFAFMVQ